MTNVEAEIDFAIEAGAEIEAFAPTIKHTRQERHHLDRAILAITGLLRARAIERALTPAREREAGDIHEGVVSIIRAWTSCSEYEAEWASKTILKWLRPPAGDEARLHGGAETPRVGGGIVFYGRGGWCTRIDGVPFPPTADSYAFVPLTDAQVRALAAAPDAPTAGEG